LGKTGVTPWVFAASFDLALQYFSYLFGYWKIPDMPFWHTLSPGYSSEVLLQGSFESTPPILQDVYRTDDSTAYLVQNSKGELFSSVLLRRNGSRL
jgi:hypothetical protein